MPFLRLFGGASLEDDAGPIAGPPAQRHRLALLALLAACHPHGVPRSELMELLWPGRGRRKSRNLLNQTVHQIRKALGGRTIRSVGDQLRLDAGYLSSDVVEFRTAVTGGEPAKAAAVASGPFLHGFVLPDAPGFERWAAGERSRLTAALGEVLEELASEEEAAGDHRAAAALWRRRVALDPYDGRGVMGLVRSMSEAGDRAGALREAEDHAHRLREELGAAPDPRVAALAASIREPAVATSDDGAITAGMGPGSVGARPEVSARFYGSRRGHGAPAASVSGPEVEPRMVGRREERERLEAAWRQAARGGAGLALISGVAGIGKSRLAHELVGWAERRGAVTARARSYAAEGSLAYGPVAEWLRSAALRESLEAVDAPWRADLAPLVPHLAGTGAEEPSLAEFASPTNGRRQRFFRALAGAVLGRGEPRLLLIDDLQWSDPDTLQWLHFLLRFEPAAPLLVLGTARTEEVGADHPLRALLAELRRDDRLGLTELELAPLDPEETGALGAAVAGRELDEREREWLHCETEGHPLFVVEGVRAGLLAGPETEPGDGTDSLPARVGTVIRARLEQLSPEAHDVARVAATVGRKFGPEVVVDASGLDRGAVADAVDELVERRIVRIAGDALDFTHDKLREVVYADLNPVRRELLHGQVAAAIEARAGFEVDAVAGVLAGHRERAGDLAAALTLYRRAAARARGVHGHEEAAGYLERALGLLDGMAFADPEERDRLELELHQQLGDSLLRTRGWAAPEVVAVHEQERELAERVGDGRALCRALWGLQSVRMVRAELSEARSLGERLREVALAEGDPLYVAASHFVIGFASFLMGAFDESAELLARGLGRYETLRDPADASALRADVGILLHCAASHAAWFLKREETALAREREARELADRLANPFARAAALVYGAMLQQYRNERDLAEERAAGAVAQAEELGFPHYLATARVVRGWAMAERGDPGAGIAEIRSALEAYDAIGSALRKPYFFGLEARVHARMGRTDRARACLDEALTLCEATGERWYEAELRALRRDVAV